MLRGITTEIAKFVGVALQVKQLRGEAFEPNILPPRSTNHRSSRLIDVDAKVATRPIKRVVEFGEHGLALGACFSSHYGQQRASIEPRTSRIQAQSVLECGQQVDRFYQAFMSGTGPFGRWIHHNQWHVDRRFVEHLFLAQPVIAQKIAMVAGEYDQRVLLSA